MQYALIHVNMTIMSKINDLSAIGPVAAAPPLAIEIRAPLARADQCPVAVYIASLTSPASKRTMTWGLRQLAITLTGNPAADPYVFPWHQLRKQHTDALRARIAGECSSIKTANLCLSALRGVLKAWSRGKIMPNDFLDLYH